MELLQSEKKLNGKDVYELGKIEEINIIEIYDKIISNNYEQDKDNEIILDNYIEGCYFEMNGVILSDYILLCIFANIVMKYHKKEYLDWDNYALSGEEGLHEM